MKTLFYAYLVLFILDQHPEFMHKWWQRDRVYATAKEVAFKTDADPQEGLRLMQIALRESGFDEKAVGKAQEKGRWQVLSGNDHSAARALWLLRHQGILGFIGCRHTEDKVTLPEGTKTTCREMVLNRIGSADDYLADHPPPPADRAVDTGIALDP